MTDKKNENSDEQPHINLPNPFLITIRETYWASEILPKQLYLGGGSDAANLKALHEHTVQHILNVADDVPNYHGPPITYLNLHVADFGRDAGISRVFERAFAFLSELEKKNLPVLVHCAAGANRSVTIVIAWLMYSRRWSLLDSFKYVKSKRRAICPMKDNRLQLLKFERQLFNNASSFDNETAFLRM